MTGEWLPPQSSFSALIVTTMRAAFWLTLYWTRLPISRPSQESYQQRQEINMFIESVDCVQLACHFPFLSLCSFNSNAEATGTGGIKEERGLKKTVEMQGYNDRLMDTTAHRALSPSSPQSKTHGTLLDEGSFKCGMSKQWKINWVIVNRLM